VTSARPALPAMLDRFGSVGLFVLAPKRREVASRAGSYFFPVPASTGFLPVRFMAMTIDFVPSPSPM